MRLGKILTSAAILCSALTWSFSGTSFAATDIFQNYEELSSHYQEGKDYVIRTQSKANDVLILAIHGGRIEKGTDELAEAIAKDDHSYYVFEALVYKDTNKDKRNDLHLTSTHFDEPTALKMTAQKNRVVSIHGATGEKEIVYMGGTHSTLRENIAKKLSAAGFRVDTASEDLNGDSPNNIVNKSRNLSGVQMELTTAQRDALLADSTKMEKFAAAVREGIAISTSYPNGRTYDFSAHNLTSSVWLNSGKPFYLTPDDYLRGVQSTIDNKSLAKIRFDIYDQNGKLLLSRTAESEGHRWFIHKTGLKTGYYKIKITNVTGNPSWVYGGLVY